MADFRETLEVTRSSKSFLAFSVTKIKEGLSTEDTMLPNPPVSVEYEDDISLERVSDVIDNFCETSDKANRAIDTLLFSGKTTIVEEY